MARGERRAMDAGTVPEEARRKTAMTLRSGRRVACVRGFELTLCSD